MLNKVDKLREQLSRNQEVLHLVCEINKIICKILSSRNLESAALDVELARIRIRLNFLSTLATLASDPARPRQLKAVQILQTR